MKFCGHCGAAVGWLAPAPQDVSETSFAERRQITVFFCDVIGSTELADQLDPEQLREVIHDYRALAGRVIERFDGHVAQYLGDGILAYFGFPVAHEDDARRALHAALRMTGELSQLNDALGSEHGITLAVRVGIHTGLVVADEAVGAERRETLALGQAPNVAARLQALAGRNEVLLTSETYQLLRDEFVCELLGDQPLKGLLRSVKVYRALRARPRRGFDSSYDHVLTPPVGRERELQALKRCLARVVAGHGVAILVTGDAGVGKSRLVQRFCDAVGSIETRWLTWRCAAYFQWSPFYPIIEFFRSFLGDESVTAVERLGALERELTALQLPLVETAPLIAALIELPLPAHYRPLEFAPPLLRAKTHATLLQILVAMTARRPVVLVVEDIHWADQSTLDLLEFLLQHGVRHRLMLVFTARPKPAFEPPWRPSDVEELVIDRLDEAEVKSMVSGICAGKKLPVEAMAAIVAKTDGVPLFVEEFTKMLLASGRLTERADRYELHGPIRSYDIPSTLQDSLLARLDHVQAVKPVVQWGSVLGRAFSFDLIAAVSGRSPERLWDDLQELIRVGLLVQQGQPPHAEFAFKHALIQEAAYGLLLKRTRRAWHRRVAEVLRHRFSETAERQPELLANHYAEAGLSESAVDCWLRAAQKAIVRCAHVEATELFRNIAFELERLPEGPERDRRELTLQTLRAATLAVKDGYIGRDLQMAYDRAAELSKRLESEPQSVVSVLAGLAGFYIVRGDLSKSQEIGIELLTAAEKTGNARNLLDANRYLALALHLQGSLVASSECYEKAFAAAARIDLATETPFESAVASEEGLVHLRANYPIVLWALGYWDRARALSDEALALAYDIKHSYSLTYAHYLASWLNQLLRRPAEAGRHAQETVTLSEERGFFFGVLGSLNLLWSQVQLSGLTVGDREEFREKLAAFRQQWDAYLAFGARGCEIYFTSLLIECHLLLEQVTKARELLDHCFTVVGATGDHWEADLYRLKGEILLAQARREGGRADPREEAEVCFTTALDIARGQSSKALELRAAISLARLMAARKELRGARDLLEPVFGWFREGLDQPELQAAHALLREFS